MRFSPRAALSLLAVGLAGCVIVTPLPAPTPAPAPAPAKQAASAAPAPIPAAPPPAPVPGEPRRYDTVITKEAQTSRGLLIYHHIKDHHYFEIPERLLGRDLFWSAEVAQASGDAAFNGLPLGFKVLRFERVDNRILLRAVSYRKRGSEDLKAATDAVDLAPIIMSFNIEAEGNEHSMELRPEERKPPPEMPGTIALVAAIPPSTGFRKEPAKEKWPVIDATRLLLTNSPDLLDARGLGPAGLAAADPSRSLINQVKVFSQNVEVRSTITFSSLSFSQQGQPNPFQLHDPSRTAVLHYSLALLPEKPMMGRFFDPRVGYFTEGFQEYNDERNGVRFRDFITRFRLEKKEPGEPLSEPVKPIVFYIAPEVPEKWRKYLKQGIEDWRPAFEQAGFKNAIVARDAPSKKEDPEWDAEDARYSVIRWVAQPVANAMGPSVYDPRSGEVISAHIIFWHDVLKLAETLYFMEAGAADTRVKSLPLGEDVMGEAMRAMATHEVGHALGLRHNHRAASAYTVAELRTPAFVAENGTTASIMSYGRFNSVAQPGDGVTSFVPKLGPYDRFAIEWGYRGLDKTTSEAETPELDQMSARQLGDPRLAFGGEDLPAVLDPQVQMENIGKERIQATRLSVASLERAAARLIPATTKLGEDYEDLDLTYTVLAVQRLNYLSSVVKLIGGVRETRYLGGRGGDTFTRTTPKEQREAIRYLLDEALQTPRWLLAPSVLNRISNFAVSGLVVSTQKNILRDMLWPLRFRVLEDTELLKPGSGMTASQYLNTVQHGVFHELNQPKPKIDVTRRELQHTYLDLVKAFTGDVQRFNDSAQLTAARLTALSIDLRPASLQALRDLQREMRAAIPKAADAPTRLHLSQLDREIEQILKVRGS